MRAHIIIIEFKKWVTPIYQFLSWSRKPSYYLMMSPLGGCEAAAAAVVCIQTYSVPTVKKSVLLFLVYFGFKSFNSLLVKSMMTLMFCLSGSALFYFKLLRVFVWCFREAPGLLDGKHEQWRFNFPYLAIVALQIHSCLYAITTKPHNHCTVWLQTEKGRSIFFCDSQFITEKDVTWILYDNVTMWNMEDVKMWKVI